MVRIAWATAIMASLAPLRAARRWTWECSLQVPDHLYQVWGLKDERVRVLKEGRAPARSKPAEAHREAMARRQIWVISDHGGCHNVMDLSPIAKPPRQLLIPSLIVFALRMSLTTSSSVLSWNFSRLLQRAVAELTSTPGAIPCYPHQQELAAPSLGGLIGPISNELLLAFSIALRIFALYYFRFFSVCVEKAGFLREGVSSDRFEVSGWPISG